MSIIPSSRPKATAEPAAQGWTTLETQDPRSVVCTKFEQDIETELVLFRHALPFDDKRAFFRSMDEAQNVVDRAVKGLPPGLRARVASTNATRADFAGETAQARTFLYFRTWSLLVEFQKAR